MSAPETRLLADEAAERFEVEALACLAGPVIFPTMESLAAAVLMLARDRQARLEMETGSKRRSV